MSTNTARELVTGEDGGAYTLSFVMAMPFLVLFICVVIETSFMLVAKIGTIYASFAGARTAIVWDSLDSSSATDGMVEQAAIRAFIPFSSGGVVSASSADRRFTEYLQEHASQMKNLGRTPANSNYLDSKAAYAARAMTVAFKRTPRGGNIWDEDLTVEVNYAFPFAVPGVGRIFGTRGPDGYVYAITSRTTLPNEIPQNEERSLGIQYGR